MHLKSRDPTGTHSPRNQFASCASHGLELGDPDESWRLMTGLERRLTAL